MSQRTTRRSLWSALFALALVGAVMLWIVAPPGRSALASSDPGNALAPAGLGFGQRIAGTWVEPGNGYSVIMNIRADGTLTNPVDEFLYHRQSHVGLYERTTDIADGVIDIRISQPTFARYLVGDGFKSGTQIIKHAAIKISRRAVRVVRWTHFNHKCMCSREIKSLDRPIPP